ncbi:MotB family protein [Pseudomonadales bacterium]|nr:MotB family protein [Pseudomonadales bacterium]
MSESTEEAQEESLVEEPIEGINEPSEPPPKKEKERECPECPGGAPPWMATFADMATLLMAFFVLILSFSNVNVPKFEQISGSLAVAFGVKRVVPMISIPKGETLLNTEFTPADAEATVIPNKSQQVNDATKDHIKQMTEENESSFDTEQDFISVKEVLAEEIEAGQVSVTLEGDEITVELLSPENNASNAESGQSLGGKVPQEVLEVAKKIVDAQSGIPTPIAVKRPIEGDKNAEGLSQETDDRLKVIRTALSAEIGSGLAEVERVGDKIIIRLGQQDSFSSGSAELQRAFQPTLQRVGAAIKDVGGIIRVEGHTDNVPVGFSDRFRSNWDLSSARSASVANYILDSTELEPGRLSISGFADSKPIASNDTLEGRARNRRIEVIVDG